MLNRRAILSLVRGFTPVLLSCNKACSSGIGSGISQTHHAGILGKRRIVMIENTGHPCSGRQCLPNKNIGLTNFCGTVLTPSVRFETTKAPHKLGAAIIVPIHPYLLSVIAIATKLNIGPYRKSSRLIDLCKQTNHATS